MLMRLQELCTVCCYFNIFWRKVAKFLQNSRARVLFYFIADRWAALSVMHRKQFNIITVSYVCEISMFPQGHSRSSYGSLFFIRCDLIHPLSSNISLWPPTHISFLHISDPCAHCLPHQTLSLHTSTPSQPDHSTVNNFHSKLITITIIPRAVTLSCLENAYSHPLYGRWLWPVK